MSIADRVRELGYEIPDAKPAAQYIGAVQAGNLLFVSGTGPYKTDGGLITGKLGADLTIEQGQEAARLCALASLGYIQGAIGELERVERFVKLLGFINSAPGFTQPHLVLNGASDLLISLFGETGRHARSAVGMYELPMNIAVEIEMIVQVKD
jgi:enamine deaminase RidA (YjgF/YER057c/UK114 family)